MMIKGFCSLLLILGLLTGCGGIAAPSGSSSLPSGSSSSLPVASSPAPSSLPETPEKPENPWGLVPLEELGAAAAEEPGGPEPHHTASRWRVSSSRYSAS